jgi:hypothetical protein
MFIRNFKGDIVFFDTHKYKNETIMYKELWYQMYNIKIDNNKPDLKKNILEYIKSPKNMHNL